MAIGNSVYQPTTVSYEPRPGSLLGQTTATTPLQMLRKPVPQMILLTFGLFSIAFGKIIQSIMQTSTFIFHFYFYRLFSNFFVSCFVFFFFHFIGKHTGIAMIVNASDNYEETEQHRENIPVDKIETTEAIDIGLIVGGILMTLFGFVLVALYIKVAEWRRHCVCPCGLSKKQGLARQLNNGNGGTQILPLNPSTDPLVSHTQYAPVSELPRPDDEECRTLMTDNKDW